MMNIVTLDVIKYHLHYHPHHFTPHRNARIATAVLATAIPSVCLSVCQYTPVLCQNHGIRSTVQLHNQIAKYV